MTKTAPTPPIQIVATAGEIQLALDHPEGDPGMSVVARAIAFYGEASSVDGTQGAGRAALTGALTGDRAFYLVEVDAKACSELDEAYRADGTAAAKRPKEVLLEAGRTSRERNEAMGLGFALAPERAKLSATREELADALRRAPRTPIGKVLSVASGAVRQPQWTRGPDGSFAHTGVDAVGAAGLAALASQFGGNHYRAVIFDAPAFEKAISSHRDRAALARTISQRAASVEQRRMAHRRPAPAVDRASATSRG